MRRLGTLLCCGLLASAGRAAPDPLDAIDAPPRAAAVGPPGAARAGASELERMLAALVQQEKDAQSRFDELGRQAALARARSQVRGRAYVRLMRAGLLPVGGGLGSLVDHATKIERLRIGLEKDLALQTRASAERAELGKRLGDLHVRRTALETEWKALEHAKTELLAAEDRQRAFDTAFRSSGAGDYAAVYSAAGPGDPGEIARGFAAQKGRLPFPIAGRTEVKSARRSGARGLELAAPVGTPVLAVYPGRVAFADDYADYGKTVILDHGDQHYTVSGNLGTIDVEVGEELSASAHIGTVGARGKTPVVYFEIRVSAVTVDPAPWFGL